MLATALALTDDDLPDLSHPSETSLVPALTSHRLRKRHAERVAITLQQTRDASIRDPQSTETEISDFTTLTSSVPDVEPIITLPSLPQASPAQATFSCPPGMGRVCP